MRHGVLLLGAVLATASLAHGQWTVKTIIANGNASNRYDIVILGDGYQTTEQAKFDGDCVAVANALLATEPYKTFQHFFNVHTVFRASAESGADHPDASPPIVKNTAYDASYNTGGTARCLYIKNSSLALQDAAKAPAVEGRVMVIVNDSRYGGCAGTFAVTYNGSSMTQVQVHEFGHSFGLLADEYDYPNDTYTGGEPSAKNVTIDSTGKTKWNHWLGHNGVGAFEGAQYYRKGIWRPKSNCIMRSLGLPLCEICAEQTVLQAYRTTNAVENPLPATSPVKVDPSAKQSFSFTNLAPASGSPTVTWLVDSKVQTATGTTLLLDTTGLSTGDHKVEVVVQDHSAFVRSDPSKLLESRHSWTLHVNGPQLPDLSAIYLSTTSPVKAGGGIDLVSVVQNTGNTASPATVAEFFLSMDKTLTTGDPYLGSYAVPALTPSNADVEYTYGVVVPAHLTPGTWNLAVVADRVDTVKEIRETDNVYWVTLVVTAPDCKAQLSYDDPLVHPPTKNAIDGAVGGSVTPVITAPCNVGDHYLILLGCAGTSPGTVLPPNSLVLPLNLDACTNVFYAGMGPPLVVGFRGRIDANGQGRAKLSVPANVVKGSIQGHFAAAVFDLTTCAFKNVTNAVGFDFR